MIIRDLMLKSSTSFYRWKACFECISDFDPIKDQIQTCKNCQNMCSLSMSNQTNRVLYTDCDTTCSDCENIMYEPHSHQCLQYQCDRPYIQGPGTTMMRKTTNPGTKCLKYCFICIYIY
jgi:hypothetical protein